MKIKNYKEAIRYLESFIGKIRFEITPEFLRRQDPLERMRTLLDLLGNPQNKFPSVLVGGTSGKGSTAYLISHILTTAGCKTGLTISPHLEKVNERLQINGGQINDEKFTDLLTSILDSIDGMKKMEVGVPSYFEILIAMAFKYFADKHVDIAVVEVGMGGEFDATNTLYPLIAVLTNVSLDHTNVLGGTVQKIAKTKGGIIKKGKAERGKRKGENNLHPSLFTLHPIVVTGVRQPSVIKIVEDRCKEVRAEVFRLHKDFKFKIKEESLEGTIFDLIIFSDRRKELNNILLSLLGKHQVENASLAIETVLQLKRFGFKVSEEHIHQALKTAFFPGRFEVFRCHPEFSSGSPARRQVFLHPNEMPKRVQHDKEKTLILDGAHNPTKMKAFLTTLKKLYPKNQKIFVIAFKNDKNIKGMLRQILQVADAILVTEFSAKTDMSNNASLEALNIKYQISNIRYNRETKVLVAKNSKTAIEKAFQIAKTQKDSLIIVTGSLYLVGEVRNYMTGPGPVN